VTHLKRGITWATDGAQAGALPIEADETVVTDGSSVVLAALGGCDPVSVAAWFADRFADLSSETLYARLWVLLEQLGHPADGAVVRSDRDQAIMAFSAEGVLVGIVRCMRGVERSTAELVVALAPSWQRRGIMTVLLERLSASARAAGIERLTTRCPAGTSRLTRAMAGIGRLTVTPAGLGIAQLCVELA